MKPACVILSSLFHMDYSLQLLTEKGEKEDRFLIPTTANNSINVRNTAGQIHCPCPGILPCTTTITSTTTTHTITCYHNTYTVQCGGDLKGTRLGMLHVELFSHPLNSTTTYPSLLADTVWRCSVLLATPAVAPAPASVSSRPRPKQRANCTGAIIVDSSQQVVKIPWQEENYQNLPSSLHNMAGARIKNTLVVCGSTSSASPQQNAVQCFKATLPNLRWTELTELKNFTRSPMLSSKESTENVWLVGGYARSEGVSAYVQTIDLNSGQVTLLPDMAFNKNISDGCSVMVDDKFLYIIGGEGKKNQDYCDSAGCGHDVTANVSMLNTETGMWTTDLPRMRFTRVKPQCLETTIQGARGILVAGGHCTTINAYKPCGMGFTSISGCCGGNVYPHENEEFFYGRLSSVEFFNLETRTWSQLGSMKETRGDIGLAVINNKVTSFSSLAYTLTWDNTSYPLFPYWDMETETVPMFYEEMDNQNQWRSVCYPTTAKSDMFLAFPVPDFSPGFTEQCSQ